MNVFLPQFFQEIKGEEGWEKGRASMKGEYDTI